MEECMDFCMRYLDDVETKSNRPTRNFDGGDDEGRAPRKGVRITLDRVTWIQCHRYVLMNTDVVKTFIDMHMTELFVKFPRYGYHQIQSIHNDTFHTWFKTHVLMIRQKKKGVTMLEKLGGDQANLTRGNASQMQPSTLVVRGQQQQQRPSNIISPMVPRPQTRSKQLPQVQSLSTLQAQSSMHTNQQQNSQSIDPPVSQPILNFPNPGETSNEITKKRGRGPAQGDALKEGERIIVDFNETFQAIGPNAGKYSSLLGRIARNGIQVPLTYAEWSDMPTHIMDYIWNEVQEISLKNALNRELLGPIHRTGRTSMPNFKRKLSAAGKSTESLTTYIEAHCKNGVPADLEAANLISQMQEKLAEVPEEEQTPELREKIFNNFMSNECHGYVRTMGLGPSPADMRTQHVLPSEHSDEFIKMIVDKVVAECMKEVNPRLNQMQVEINSLQSKLEITHLQFPSRAVSNEKVADQTISHIQLLGNQQVVDKFTLQAQQLERPSDINKHMHPVFSLRDEEDSEDE